MLCLSLKPGEYLTIGENVHLQYDCTSGDRCKLLVDAPREVRVMRGTLLERGGESRPSGLSDRPRSHRSGVSWDRSKAQALAAMRKLLWEMDGRDDDVKTLRRQLNHMFPESSATGG